MFNGFFIAMKTVKMEARYLNIGLFYKEIPVTADTALEIFKAFELLPTKKLLSDAIMPSVHLCFSGLFSFAQLGLA